MSRALGRKHRRTCLRWAKVDGERQTCGLPDMHPGDCAHVIAARRLAREAELSQLLGDHSDAECVSCEAYLAAVNQGRSPADALHLRCDWAISLHRELNPGDAR